MKMFLATTATVLRERLDTSLRLCLFYTLTAKLKAPLITVRVLRLVF